jgi:hypothetical protein
MPWPICCHFLSPPSSRWCRPHDYNTSDKILVDSPKNSRAWQSTQAGNTCDDQGIPRASSGHDARLPHRHDQDTSPDSFRCCPTSSPRHDSATHNKHLANTHPFPTCTSPTHPFSACISMTHPSHLQPSGSTLSPHCPTTKSLFTLNLCEWHM